MDELTKLKAQRKEIDERIKQLMGKERSVGRAKICRQHYPTDLPDRWSLSIKLIDFRHYHGKNHERYFPVIASDNRGMVVNEIPNLIESLKTLFDEEIADMEASE